MSDMTHWGDEDDLDLTADDIGSMLEEGAAAHAVGPHLPGNAVFVKAAPTYGVQPVRVAPPVLRPPLSTSQPAAV